MAEPCAPEVLNSQTLLTLWNLFQMQSMCDLELHYLLVRYEAIKILMGCYTRQVDFSLGNSGGTNRTTLTQRRDGRSQAQNTGQNTAFSDAVGSQVFNDESISTSQTSSFLSSGSGDDAHTYGTRTDKGTGFSYSTSLGDSFNSTVSTRNAFSSTKGVTESKRKTRGCDYEHTANVSNSNTLSGGVAVITAEISGSATVNNWDKYYNNLTKSFDNAERHGFNRSVRLSYSNSRSETRSAHGSHFNNLVDGWNQSENQSAFASSAGSVRHSLGRAHGEGGSANRAKTQAEASAQGTSDSYDDGEVHRRAIRTSFKTLNSVNQSQRFKHLLTLLKNTEELINYSREHLRGGFRASIGVIQICKADGYCNLQTLMHSICCSQGCS